MVSTGLKVNKLSIKHLAKTFYFVYFFKSKARSKRFGEFHKNRLKFG